MPTISVSEPGDVLAPFTAGAAAAAQAFSCPARSNALLSISGTAPWAYSSDGVNFANIPAGVSCLFPLLAGQTVEREWQFKRTGGVDSILSIIVAG